jgi:hypothetical protein
MKSGGLYCVEIADWKYGGALKPSVVHGLQLVANTEGRPFQHATFSTAPELEFHLKKWTHPGSSAFPYLFLATHGHEGTVHAQKFANKNITRDNLGLEWFEKVLAGRAAGKVLLFGGCSVLASSRKELKHFLQVTKAKAVLGYSEDADWLDAAIVEIGLFGQLPHSNRIHLTALRNAVDRARADMSPLLKRLGFKMVEA